MAPISILPPEILREIFLYFQPYWSLQAQFPKEAVQLSTVCKRWRSIIINISLLWTQVICRVPWSNDYQRFRGLLSWLEIYLKRSGSLPLDVELEIHDLSEDMQHELFQFLMEKAPFHRWQSLDLYYSPLPPRSTSLAGEFSSLIFFAYRGCPIGDCPFLPIVNRSATQLRQLDVISRDAQSMMKLCPSIMGRISALTTAGDMDNLNLPSNITKIHVGNLPLHHSPYIVSITTEVLSLNSFNPSRFPNLGELEVTTTLRAFSRAPSPITIHSLRCLIIRAEFIPALDLIRAPSLESLQILHPCSATGYWVHKTVDSPLYDLSPVDLILQAEIDQNILILLLSKSPRVETLTLRLADEEPCEWLVEALLERMNRGEKDGKTNSWKLCTCLITLRIKLLQDQKNTEMWKACLQRIPRGRKGSVFRSITCEWQDGNETTVLA
jgi:hypothetical protein